MKNKFIIFLFGVPVALCDILAIIFWISLISIYDCKPIINSTEKACGFWMKSVGAASAFNPLIITILITSIGICMTYVYIDYLKYSE